MSNGFGPARPNLTPLQLEARRKASREYHRRRRATPEGRAAHTAATLKHRNASPENVLAARKAKQDWSNSEAGHAYFSFYRAVKRETDPGFRLRSNLASRLCRALKKEIKSAHTAELVGCSIEQLKKHLAGQFLPGMTWENYGLWEVDHKVPCRAFDLVDPAQQRECFHYTNLQPLWLKDHWEKSAQEAAIARRAS